MLHVVKQQFGVAKDYLDTKKSFWSEYTKLYLNQWRKMSNPLGIGSKMLFTKFQDQYAIFALDDKNIEFEPRSLKDQEKCKILKKMQEYDWDEFHGTKRWNDWLWDALFFGVGIMDVTTFDTKNSLIVPKTQNPFFAYFDPLAVEFQKSRFFGRLIYKTYWELENEGKLDTDKVKEMVERNPSQRTATTEEKYVEDAKEILTGVNSYLDPKLPTSYYAILEWYMRNAGKTYVVWSDVNGKNVLGWEQLDYADDDVYGSKFPFILKYYHKYPGQIIGIGLPDILEDSHRAKVTLMNSLLEAVRNDAIPQFLYNYKALLNRRDLLTREIRKNIPVEGDPTNVIMPYPKSNAVSQEALGFINMLDQEGDSAIGSNQIFKASLKQLKKSATEIAQAKAKQDQFISARSYEMVDSDQQFWHIWLKRYKKFMTGAKEKVIRVTGESGMKVLELRKDDFMPSVDPDIKVVSKLTLEPQKVLRRRELAETLPIAQQTGGNVRELLKRIYYDMDFRNEDIVNLLPLTPDEVRINYENELINNNQLPPLHPNDNDALHISGHMKAEDNKVRALHLQLHTFNYLNKTTKPEQPKPGGGPQNAPSQNQVEQSLTTKQPQTTALQPQAAGAK